MNTAEYTRFSLTQDGDEESLESYIGVLDNQLIFSLHAGLGETIESIWKPVVGLNMEYHLMPNLAGCILSCL